MGMRIARAAAPALPPAPAAFAVPTVLAPGGRVPVARRRRAGQGRCRPRAVHPGPPRRPSAAGPAASGTGGAEPGVAAPAAPVPSSPRRALRSIYAAQQPALKFPPGDGPLARDLFVILNHPVIEVATAGLVLGQCAVFALQTVGFTGVTEVLLIGYERLVSALFVIEYFSRWYSVGLVPRFLLTRTMLIDFCAVLVPLGLSATPFSSTNQFGGLFVRALRFARVFQLQRVIEEDEMYNIFGDVPRSTRRVANVLLTVFTLIYVSAGLFYDFELDVNPEVTNMFVALYWSINTLTTVGPGDVIPVTAAGRIISTATVLIGAVLVPLQLSEIASAVMESPFSPSPPDAGATPPFVDVGMRAALFDESIQCTRCGLRIHQRDARFCRNCATALPERRQE